MIQLNLQTQKFSLLLLLIVLKLSIDLTQTGSMGELRLNDLAVANSDDEYQQRRDFDLKKLRHFLLTSNAEERAYRREQQAALKRDLIREYLRSIQNNADTNEIEDVKKRFTYCSPQDILHGSLCRRRSAYY